MFAGKIAQIRLNATVNQNVVTYPVIIEVPNPDEKLRPNMTATSRSTSPRLPGCFVCQTRRCDSAPRKRTATRRTAPRGKAAGRRARPVRHADPSARSLINDPAIILADESTGKLDSVTSEEIMALFQELNDHGKTIILITHEHDIAAHAKRIVHVRDGRILSDEKHEQVRVRQS